MKIIFKLLLFVVLIILGISAYKSFMQYKNQPKTEPTVNESKPSPTPTKNTVKMEIPEEYAVAQDSNANVAHLKFAVSLDAKTVSKQNIKVCTVSVSAGSAGSTSCELDEGYKLSYDSKSSILTISETTKTPENQGAIFRTGCAACVHVVMLEDLKTSDGQILPKKTVLVY